MTDTQLYLAIGVPIVMNGLMFMITNMRITDLKDSINIRLASLETRFEILTGKVAELTDRVTRLEERWERH